MSYSAQALRAGRYYGSAFFASVGFTKGRIVTAWKTEKVYDFLLGFITVDFVLALHAAPKGCKIFVLKFDCEIPRAFGEIKVYTFGIGYFNGRGWEFRNVTGSVGHFRLGIIL